MLNQTQFLYENLNKNISFLIKLSKLGLKAFVFAKHR